MTSPCATGDSFPRSENRRDRTEIRVEEIAGRCAELRYVRVLKAVKRRHLNLPVLRRHPRWGGLANSDLMPGIIAGLLRQAAVGGVRFDLDALPSMIRVEPDQGGFMAFVHLVED